MRHRNIFKKKVLTASVAVAVLGALTLAAGSQQAPDKPGEKDKCPVCGMFVAKYPNFLARIVFKDGSYAFFDGVKDMFRYYFGLKTYNPEKTSADIASVSVTEYYGLTLIDGKEMFYVMGSDVRGPMGNELIPIAGEDRARTFLEDHKGTAILKFSQITPEIIKNLD